jgi:hypothetical protein
MSSEHLNLVISTATLVVLLAAALAAVVQLRHIRASNESATFSNAFLLWYSPDVQRGLRFIQHELEANMKDPTFRAGLDTAGAVDHEQHPELYVIDYFDNVAIYVVLGNVREAMILLPAAQLIDHLWQTLSPTIAIMRRRRGKQLYCSFEYIAARARLWNQRYPDGYLPLDFERVPLVDVWREADGVTRAAVGPQA